MEAGLVATGAVLFFLAFGSLTGVVGAGRVVFRFLTRGAGSSATSDGSATAIVDSVAVRLRFGLPLAVRDDSASGLGSGVSRSPLLLLHTTSLASLSWWRWGINGSGVDDEGG